LELPSYQRKENFGADETFYQIVRKLAHPVERSGEITCNLIGPTALGFRHRDDIVEITKLLNELGVKVNVCAPMHATPDDITNLGRAHFNVLMYPETGETACRHMERMLGLPFTKTVPIGVSATKEFVEEVLGIIGRTRGERPFDSRLPWYSASVDSTYLTASRSRDGQRVRP